MNWYCYYIEVVRNLSVLSVIIISILFFALAWIVFNTLYEKKAKRITDIQIEINIKSGFKLFICMIPFILFLVFSPSGDMFKTLCELQK